MGTAKPIEEKETEFDAAPFGIIGLETALGLVLTQLVDKKVLSLAEALTKMTYQPAKILKLERGALNIGAPATLTLFDPMQEWTVDMLQLKSKSRNTPFHGWKLKGKVFGLYNKGRWWQNRWR